MYQLKYLIRLSQDVESKTYLLHQKNMIKYFLARQTFLVALSFLMAWKSTLPFKYLRAEMNTHESDIQTGCNTVYTRKHILKMRVIEVRTEIMHNFN